MEVFRYRTWAALCAAVIFGATVCAQTAGTNNGNSAVMNVTRALPGQSFDLDNHHKIRPGDKLSFRIAEDREDAKSLPVTDSGEIELPQPFGRFAAAGKTCKTLAQEIKTALEKDYYKRATVHLGLDALNSVRGRAYVSGQVTKPGPVDIPVNQPLKLSQAILQVGPTQWAKLTNVKVVRENGQTIIADVDAVLNKGKVEKDMVLEPGDLIIVPERGVVFGN
jgi:protein involved in polysaccharide export with SLBB domain